MTGPATRRHRQPPRGAHPGRCDRGPSDSTRKDAIQNPIPLSGFIQVAVVVHDLDTTLTTWCELLGVRRPPVRVTQAVPDPDQTYRGTTACYGLRFAVIDCAERGFVIEVDEPDEHPSTFREFLDKHGQGVHHLGFQVGPARDAVVNELEELGYALRTVGMYPDGSWTVVDTEDRLGVNLNIKPHP